MNIFKIDRKFKYLFWVWGFICILSILEAFILNLFTYDLRGVIQALVLPMLRFVSGIIAVLLILVPIYDFLKHRRMRTKIIGFVVGALIYIIMYKLILVVLYRSYYNNLSLENIYSGMYKVFLDSPHHIAAYYSFLMSILFATDYFMERREAMMNASRIEKELSMAKLTNLKNQLQPHFLFNSLNSVVAIMDEKKQSAQEMLIDLSDFLRTSLDIDFSKKISLEEELAISQLYLNIEKKRFEHQLDITIVVNEETKKTLVPPFIIQPLVENAIKHGFSSGNKKLHLNIETFREEEWLIIRVTNNGSKIREDRKGLGIANLRARLFNEYKNDFCFTLEQKGNLVENRIRIKL